MLTTLSQISWILAGFAVGHILRRTGVAKEHDGSFLFRLVFYVCVPALVFNSLARVEITQHLLLFTLLSTLFYVVGYAVGVPILRRMELAPLQKPVFLIGAMGVNSIFAIPFLQSIYGSPGIARYVAFDIANTILLYSWAYSVAVRANPLHEGGGMLVNRLVKSPPLYGIAVGLVVNVFNIKVPDALMNTASTFSAPTGFLVTLAIGVVLHPQREDLAVALRTIAVRMGTAIAVGVAMIIVFGLHGLDRTAVLLFCVSPIAFSTATFASLENLDTRFAAGTLSISLVFAIVASTAVVLVFA